MTYLQPVDFWARVPLDGLPRAIVAAFEHQDWAALRVELSPVMDGISTDGVYGRALLQVVRDLPLGVDPVFDRWRAATAIDYGDWDDLARCLARGVMEAEELVGIRDIWLAPSSWRETPRAASDVQARLYEAYEVYLQFSPRKSLRWARALQAAMVVADRWSRQDVPRGRHFRYRALHHAVMNAAGEAHGGRLPIAIGLAHEARRLGDEGEPLRDTAWDLEILVKAAMGRAVTEPTLRTIERAPRADGLSPLGTFETTYNIIPFLGLIDLDHVRWAAQIQEHIASRLASPRAQLQAEAWIVASELMHGRPGSVPTELPALLAQSRGAAPGLRALPQLLRGIAHEDASSLRAAEGLARQAGNVWLQVSALIWLTALEPGLHVGRTLQRLIRVTGWRRPVLCRPEIAAEAALGVVASGIRGTEIVEMVAATGRASAIIEIARRHFEDGSDDAQLAAVDALAGLKATGARELLHIRSRRDDAVARAAKAHLTRRPEGALSPREIEVVELARDGMTNRQIAERLVLSEHTIARHLANARGKLGAANRTEAAARLATLRD